MDNFTFTNIVIDKLKLPFKNNGYRCKKSEGTLIFHKKGNLFLLKISISYDEISNRGAGISLALKSDLLGEIFHQDMGIPFTVLGIAYYNFYNSNFSKEPFFCKTETDCHEFVNRVIHSIDDINIFFDSVQSWEAVKKIYTEDKFEIKSKMLSYSYINVTAAISVLLKEENVASKLIEYDRMLNKIDRQNFRKYLENFVKHGYLEKQILNDLEPIEGESVSSMANSEEIQGKPVVFKNVTDSDLLEELLLDNFDPGNEPVLRLQKDGSCYIAFNAMPPFAWVMSEEDEINFTKELSEFLDVAVERTDREFFEIRHPQPDTVEKIKTYISTYRERKGYLVDDMEEHEVE